MLILGKTEHPISCSRYLSGVELNIDDILVSGDHNSNRKCSIPGGSHEDLAKSHHHDFLPNEITKRASIELKSKKAPSEHSGDSLTGLAMGNGSNPAFSATFFLLKIPRFFKAALWWKKVLLNYKAVIQAWAR